MQFHDVLNPKLWDKKEDNYVLKAEVLDKLNEIALAFIEYAEIPEDGIEDIVLTGSSANYNYTPYSDLDLHIVVDYDSLHEDCPLVEGYLWGMKNQFNKEHDISIYDIPVEVYAEDKNSRGISNGVYSVFKGEWEKVPEKLAPTDNDASVEAKYNELKEAIERCDDSEEAQLLLDKIYQMRKAGLADGGELSTENLAFKKLRDNRYMDKLKEIKKEQIDKELSLESASIQDLISLFDVNKYEIDNSRDTEITIKNLDENNFDRFIVIKDTTTPEYYEVSLKSKEDGFIEKIEEVHSKDLVKTVEDLFNLKFKKETRLGKALKKLKSFKQ